MIPDINTVGLFCKINHARMVPGEGNNHLPNHHNGGFLFADL